MNPLSFSLLTKEEEYDRLQNQFVRQTIEILPTFKEQVDIAGNIQEQIHQQLQEFQEKTEEIENRINDSFECEICGGKYSHFNKNRHNATKKHKSAMLSLPTTLSLPLISPLLEREKSVAGTSP